MARALQFIANLALLFTQYESLIDRFGAAKSVGFRAVELMFPYDYSIEQLIETKNRTGLDIVLFNAWPGSAVLIYLNQAIFTLPFYTNREPDSWRFGLGWHSWQRN